jgi:hypothetical protein
MRPLNTAELLEAWEHSLDRPAVQRALILLAAASPEASPESLAELTIGQRDGSLLTLHEWTFGSRLSAMAACPACQGWMELTFDSSQLRQREGNTQEELSLEQGDYSLRFRLPDSRDLAALESASDADSARRLLLERCISAASRDGAEISTADLPEELFVLIARRMAQADPQADIQLSLTCPACQHAWSAPFDILGYFWSELQHWARRILSEVHLLAGAYGWSEAEILALHPRRRQAYLELVSA